MQLRLAILIKLIMILFLYRILHELMHAVGFWHEQSRPDRDQYVKILTHNIIEKEKDNFHKYRFSESNFVGYYDYCSIMHYELDAFSKYKGLKTIQIKRPIW